jgi:hypothetical protein
MREISVPKYRNGARPQYVRYGSLADITQARAEVRFVPKADIGSVSLAMRHCRV